MTEIEALRATVERLQRKSDDELAACMALERGPELETARQRLSRAGWALCEAEEELARLEMVALPARTSPDMPGFSEAMSHLGRLRVAVGARDSLTVRREVDVMMRRYGWRDEHFVEDLGDGAWSRARKSLSGSVLLVLELQRSEAKG